MFVATFIFYSNRLEKLMKLRGLVLFFVKSPCRTQLINSEFIYSGDDQAFYWRTSEDGVFDDVLPFTEFTMTGKDYIRTVNVLPLALGF